MWLAPALNPPPSPVHPSPVRPSPAPTNLGILSLIALLSRPRAIKSIRFSPVQFTLLPFRPVFGGFLIPSSSRYTPFWAASSVSSVNPGTRPL